MFAAIVLGVAGGLGSPRAIGCVSAVWWMPYYPIWSLAYIALSTLVIYSLAAYGGMSQTA